MQQACIDCPRSDGSCADQPLIFFVQLKVGSISEQKALEAGLAGCSAQEVEACLSTQTPGVIKEVSSAIRLTAATHAIFFFRMQLDWPSEMLETW